MTIECGIVRLYGVYGSFSEYMPSDSIHTFQHYSVCSNEVRSDAYDKCSNIKLIKMHILNFYLINLSTV